MQKKSRKEFPIKGWRWAVYILGCLGFVNLIFWIYQYIGYMMYNYGEKFFTDNFHRRTYYWGWFYLSILLIMIIGFLWAAI